MVSLPRALLRGKDAVPKSPIPLPLAESSPGYHPRPSLVPWTPPSWRHSRGTARILISELHGCGWINCKMHLALFSRPLWSLGVSPGSLGVLTPPICSIRGSVPASVIGNSGKRWTFSQCCNLLYVYRAAELVGRYLLRKQGGFPEGKSMVILFFPCCSLWGLREERIAGRIPSPLLPKWLGFGGNCLPPLPTCTIPCRKA